MADITIFVQCSYNDCHQRTRVLVTQAEKRQARSAQKQKLIYCEHCNRASIVTVSATWDTKPLTLGDDDVLTLSEGIPVIQGQKA